MKKISMLIALFSSCICFAQVKIHAHNDYEKAYPLINALRYSVFSIEADVFPGDNDLFVAHTKNNIKANETLNKLYLQPILSFFKKHKGSVSSDTSYQLALVIDIKEKGEQVIQQLINLLEPNKELYDRKLNRHAVQIIISGDRGSLFKWTSYPQYLYFDGRPYESYDNLMQQRVAMISDSYTRYADDSKKIEAVINKVHSLGKPLRFWGAPDDEQTWRFLYSLGVDIINTDKVEACSQYFKQLPTF